MSSLPIVWRLGHPSDPVGFVPHDLCSWTYRFDDPKREYRTLYVAEERLTCFLEIFQDLRPNAEALALYSQLSDAGDGLDEHMAGVITAAHLANRVLCEAEIAPQSACVLHLAHMPVRLEFARKLAVLMVRLGIQYLDLGDIQGNNRQLTQAISRRAFEDAYDVIHFPSKLDGVSCYVLFENRALLALRGEPVVLTVDMPEIQMVCALFGLRVV
jgi:hypothetical protein